MIRWDDEKDRKLRALRGIGFADVLDAIADGRLLVDEPHPRQDRYPGQRLLIVAVEGYACIVPYVRDEQGLFLKTIYPSRTAQRRFRDLLA